MAKSKGSSCGSCCCGGCWSPPHDSEAATSEIIAVQQYCCKCIPRFLCVSILDSYGSSSFFFTRTCSTGSGGAVQFVGNVAIDNQSASMTIGLEVVDSLCYLKWNVSSLSLNGQSLIDHTQQASDYQCKYGMKTKACVEFGGEWDLGSGRTLTISIPNSLDIFNLIKCAGCKCMCRCLCMSIWKIPNGGSLQLIGSNELVCAELIKTPYDDCGITGFYEGDYKAVWSSSGWSVELKGGNEIVPYSRTIVAGTEQPYSPCTIGGALFYSDEYEHEITSASNTSSVIYEFDSEDRKGLSLKWIGRSHNEDSYVVFEAYDWTSSTWITLGSVSGRPSTTTLDTFFNSNLEAKYTGTGVNQGIIKIKLTSLNSLSLHSNLLRIITDRCCELELIPPDSVTPTSTISKVNLSQEGNCPSPFKFWNFFDTNGDEWYITIECSWCGDSCGSVSTGCCPRTIPKTLFAEITMGCSGCAGTTTVVPIISTTSAVWDGSVYFCGQLLEVSFSCNGSNQWVITVDYGVCTYTGTSSSVSCDPFNVDFSGNLGGGIGCCPGTSDSSTSITITVLE